MPTAAFAAVLWLQLRFLQLTNSFEYKLPLCCR